MTYRAARVMPGVFAAIGVVAASGRGDSLRAADEPSIPLIAVHGMRDANVAFDGAGPAVRTWARRNGCDAGETIDTLDAGATVRTSYPSCPGSRAVAFYAMVNGGHGWPNAGVREAPFPTTLVMWSFFRESAMSSR